MTPQTTEMQTQRLILREIEPPDAFDLTSLFSSPDVQRYLFDAVAPDADWVLAFIDTSVRDFDRRGLGMWAARLLAQDVIVGVTGFRDFHDPPRMELLCALRPDHWGKGLATEMAAASVEYAFAKTAIDHVRASTDAPNQASIAVMERLGMGLIERTPATPWEQVHYAVDRGQWTPPGR